MDKGRELPCIIRGKRDGEHNDFENSPGGADVSADALAALGIFLEAV
ncbi:MAG: hypothetical protein Q4C22_03730 [Bacillota bacterium]|nr:hypothetical protein [Bacillota bacterium]